MFTGEENLSGFYRDMSANLGEGFETYNLHQVMHVPDCVKYLGPLWSFAMFRFEDFNSTVLDNCNGTQGITLQMMERLGWRRSIRLLHDQVGNFM